MIGGVLLAAVVGATALDVDFVKGLLAIPSESRSIPECNRAVAYYCREIALVPQYGGRDMTPPAAVVDAKAVRVGLRATLTWRHPPADGARKAVFTAVYRGDARHPVALVPGTSFDLGPAPEGTWRLVALDRLQNAAEPVVVEVR